MAVVAAARHVYVMLVAIPDANQTFRQITFEVIAKQVESDIRPRVFFEDFPGWVLYARDAPPGRRRLEGRPGRRHQQAGRHGPVSSPRGAGWSSTAQSAGRPGADDGTRYSVGNPGETQHLPLPRAISTMAPEPGDGVPHGRSPAGPDRKDDRGAARRHGDQAIGASGAVAAPGNHPDPAEVLVPGRLPRLRDHRPGARPVRRPRRQAGRLRRRHRRDLRLLRRDVPGRGTDQGHYRGIESAKGLGTTSFATAHLSRWWPNIVLGVFGIAALVWRARFAEPQLPRSIPLVLPSSQPVWTSLAECQAARAPCPRPSRVSRKRPRIVVVVRVPRLTDAGTKPARPLRQQDLPARRRRCRSWRCSDSSTSRRSSTSPTSCSRGPPRGHGDAAARLPDAAVRLFRHPDRGAAERAGHLRPAVAHRAS